MRQFEPLAGLAPGYELTAAERRIEYLASEPAPPPSYGAQQYVLVSVDPDSGQSSRVAPMLPTGSYALLLQGPQTRHVRVDRSSGTWISSERRQ